MLLLVGDSLVDKCLALCIAEFHKSKSDVRIFRSLSPYQKDDRKTAWYLTSDVITRYHQIQSQTQSLRPSRVTSLNFSDSEVIRTFDSEALQW